MLFTELIMYIWMSIMKKYKDLKIYKRTFHATGDNMLQIRSIK